MNIMKIVNVDTIAPKEFAPGILGKVVHSENMTIIYWDIKEGSILPDHSHINEQITQLTHGEFELTIESKKFQLGTNRVVIIPGNAKHSGKAITDCKITDVFYPKRSDL